MTTETKRMLIAMAHPDDESFAMAGTILKYVAEGVEVSLICATNGDVGTVDEEFMQGHETIASLRLSELACASEILGFTEVITFGYRDSGMAGTPDNEHPDCLAAADVNTVTARVVEVMRRLKPQVVITFDPFGGYGHPDHIAIHKAAVKAFDAVSDSAQYPEAGEAYQPQKLYYQTFDRRMMRIIVRVMKLLGKDVENFGRNKDINLYEIAMFDVPVNTQITIKDYKEQGDRAAQCHASQIGGMGSNKIMGLIMGLILGKKDTYSQVIPTHSGKTENNLFSGVSY